MENNDIDIASMITKLMSDPAAVETVRQLKESVGGASASSGDASSAQEDARVHTAEQNDDVSSRLSHLASTVAPLLKNSGLSGGTTSQETERRNRLLSALKPYLSDGRQGMIDTVMSLSKISGIIDLIPKEKE